MKSILLLVSILSVSLISCNSENTNNKKGDTENLLNDEQRDLNLSGKVYSYGKDVGKYECEVVYEIGDGGTSILFLNNKEFVEYTFGVAYLYLRKGTYTLNDDKLELNFSSDAIEGEMDQTMEAESDEMDFKKVKSKSKKSILEVGNCSKAVYFIPNDDYIQYLAFDNSQTAESFQQKMQSEGTWQLLGLPVKDFSKSNESKVKKNVNSL